jgi:hypothetical protein
MRRSLLEEVRGCIAAGRDGASPRPLLARQRQFHSVLHDLSPGRDTIVERSLRNEQECFAGGVNA